MKNHARMHGAGAPHSLNISLMPAMPGRDVVAAAEVASLRMFQSEHSVFIFIPDQANVASQHRLVAMKCQMLHCEKINASLFFRDLDSTFRVVYGPPALADADIAWGKHGDPLGEGAVSAFIRNVQGARAHRPRGVRSQ